METERRLALLIDGDNAQAALLPQILDAVNQYGRITIRRIYGDWSKPHMSSWEAVLQTYALEQIQQRSYTKGKNTTDIALIIDAMEILFTEEIDGFCIASSDGDYTLLATRILKKKKFVLGIGKKNTPATFVDACYKFIYTEDLPSRESMQAKPNIPKPSPPKESTNKKVVEDDVDTARLKKLLRKAFDSAVHEDGWAHLSAMGDFLQQHEPGFDYQKYGHKQLKQLVQAYPKFIEVKERKIKSGSDVTYVRLKGNPQPKK